MFGGNNPPTGTGSTTKPSGGFSFGTPVATSNAGGGSGFSFGGTPQPAGTPGGFSFGGTTSTAQPSASPSSGFSFGATTQAATVPTGFSSGTMPQSTGGLSVGSISAQPGGTSGFSMGGTATQPAPSSGFSLSGTPTQPAATSGTGFSLGGTATQASATPGFTLPGTTQTAAVPQPTVGGFNLPTQSVLTRPGVPSSTQPATAGFNLTTKPLVQTTAQPSTTGGFGLQTQQTVNLGGLTKPTQPTGTQPTSTAAPGIFGGAIKIGATSGTTSTQPVSNLGVASGFPTSAAPGLGGLEKTKTTTVGFSLPASTAASSGATVPQKEMNYQQLEENINKWMQDLENQEKEFLEQATHVNAWDRFLVENGEKITYLNSDMERVKVEQQKLDHELDFIKSQQRELDEMLIPLEKSVEEQQNISFQQHADLERENTYQLAENVDAQLKRMLQDLKEIIDHLNTSNASQDNTDPIFQITQILNSHMDSLQWIDQNSALLKRHVEDISKQMETQRKEQERNFRLVYN